MTYLFTLIIILVPVLSFGQAKTVKLIESKGEGYVELSIVNDNPFPISVDLSIPTATNLRADKSFPVTDVIEMNSKKVITRFTVINSSQKWSYKSNYKWYTGDVRAFPDLDYAYRFPFKENTSAMLSQGYNGSFSHKGDGRFSLDFRMPIGTPIYAARGGRVIKLEKKYKEGGIAEHFKTKANYITILHSDGTMADYVHLMYQGVAVRVGITVERGQLIGYSGSTGYSGRPHLHFTVKKTKKGGGFQSFPTKFATKDGVIRTFVVGKYYSAY